MKLLDGEKVETLENLNRKEKDDIIGKEDKENEEGERE